MGECWTEGTATFMILGNVCTRSCGFCGVKTGRPEDIDWDEPEKVARSIRLMEIKHAVITSVDRDDIKDMGSIIWAETVKAIRRMNPNTTLETLIPDFQGNTKNIDRIIAVKPEVVSHNMETVKRLTREVRIQAKYERSLEVLRYLKEKGIERTKSGIMLGLGENEEEVLQTMQDLRNVGLDIITIGQYLQPSKKHLPVKEFITPEQFKKYETIGLNMGFRHVETGAKKVILSVPPIDESIKTVVLGVNEYILETDDVIISNASCTTNNAAPMLKLIHEKYGIEEAYITTIHSYTTDQSLHDQPHRDLRRARAAGQSIVPTTTGAAKALTKIFPDLSDAIGGCGIRVPVPNGSLCDITMNVKKDVSIDDVNRLFKIAAEGTFKNIIEYTEDPIVSIDILGNTHSCVFDSQMT
eukprot:maker-scaffold4420_size5995-snap-gene-0.0 protein:Tk10481 transcript:maker-scaffold4420_size5995-snap-gene-0.0-mRNA-1 annotation:"lipoate synthase"